MTQLDDIRVWNPTALTGGGRPVSSARRGTALVFILGVLTLVALVGLVLIARTHGEYRRVTHQATAASAESAMNGVVRGIQDTLRRDIWAGDSAALYPLTTPTVTAPVEEKNEPWDAPGPDDRWLASICPYMLPNEETANPDPDGSPRRIAARDAAGNPLAYEDKVLAWPYVSYLGGDLLSQDGLRYVDPTTNPPIKIGSRPFAWAADSRSPASATPQPVFYNAPPPDPLDKTNKAAVEHVAILQTPPTGMNGPLIVGSTTNRSIAQAKTAWRDSLHLAALAASPQLAGRSPQFPYFDTNADGIVDLYDADGDGIPDSPLSFALPLDSSDPTAARELYAAIRIVDHSGMLNINSAGTLLNRNDAPIFGEAGPDFQRRGRRIAELLIDGIVSQRDLSGGRARDLLDYRWNDTSTVPDPRALDANVIRRWLTGGVNSGGFLLYGQSEEASLRHRGGLAPYSRRGDANPVGADFTSVDKALQWTLLACRNVAYDAASGSYYYDWSQPPRWSRYNSDYQPYGSSTTYEGYANADGVGWRDLLREDEPFSIKRPMLTTVSHATVPPPAIARGGVGALDLRLAALRDPSLNMDWPVLNAPAYAPPDPPFVGSTATLSGRFANLPSVPDHLRAQQIDLNMNASVPGDREAIRWDFIRYCAAAMFLATENQAGLTYQGIPLSIENRQFLAWQFALNVADYRDADADNEPTALEWPVGSGRYLFGVEMQPFFTEAYAYLAAGNLSSGPVPIGGPSGQDRWFHAVELYVPPYWKIPTSHLYLRSPGSASAGLVPLSQFLTITGNSPPGGASGVIDGGVNGQFLVLCGSTSAAPTTVTTNPLYTSFHRNPSFEFAKDGKARVELVWSPTGVATDPKTHVLDVIGQRYGAAALSGLPLAPPDPVNKPFAQRPPGALDGSKHEFSLLRSTNGWRFTTAWHVYKYALVGVVAIGQPGGLQETLGKPNEPGAAGNTTIQLDNLIPPLVWPGRGVIGSSPLTDGFNPGRPYNSFDSVGDLGRMMMIGPIKLVAGLAPDLSCLPKFSSLAPPLDLPTTFMLATILQVPSGQVCGVPPNSYTTHDLEQNFRDRLSAGHVDLGMVEFRRNRPNQQPWTNRLFEFFTTQSPLFDGVDNDGDLPNVLPPGGVDFGGATTDVTEGLDVLYRLAGRININTAPASVLRCVPFVSVLPSSPEYQWLTYGSAGPPSGFSPYTEYRNDPRRFWDLASAIVARRENRSVPLRLIDTDTAYTQPGTSVSRLRMVANLIRQSGPVAIGGPADSTLAFRSVADLAKLSKDGGAKLIDTMGNSAAFWLDRANADPTIASDLNRALGNHKLATGADPDLGRADAFSPDFRFRRTGGTTGEVDYSPIPNPFVAAKVDPATARGREVFLSRWANLLTTRSDVFTAYIALIDENGHYVRRAEVTLDRSDVFREFVNPAGVVGSHIARFNVAPRILTRTEGSYADDTR